MPHLTAGQAQLRELLRRLAEFEPVDAPVVSAYLDLRPGASENPQVRTGQIVLRDTLRGALADRDPHTPEHESLLADVERINAQIDELLPGARGAAVFACSAGELFEWAATAAPLANDVSVGARPRLTPLARLADPEPALVALVDSQTMRLFATRSGELRELGLIEDDPAYQRTEAGGWSQSRYQRHVDEHREAFAELSAQAIEQNATAEGSSILLLCGDEVAVPLLESALSKRMAEALRGTLRADIRAPVEAMTELCLPELERIRSEDGQDAADRMIGAAEGDGMGVAGLDETLAALRLGQAMEVLVGERDAETHEPLVDDDALDELVRLALSTDARVRFVAGHAGLAERGGVGALLRFRLDRAASTPREDAEDVAATLA